MHEYWAEFLLVAGLHLGAVASPGPDFALVLKQSLVHGRKAAIWTSIGVGSAILLHVTYSLFGLGLLIRGSELWFTVVKFGGAAYIAWLGIQSLQARSRPEAEVAAETAFHPGKTGAFMRGFLTNALNPKATLFFISLFVMAVSPTTPKFIQAVYGLWMALATAAWFCLVAVLFAHDRIRRKFLRYGHWIDRALGVVFLALAASLLLTTVR